TPPSPRPGASLMPGPEIELRPLEVRPYLSHSLSVTPALSCIQPLFSHSSDFYSVIPAKAGTQSNSATHHFLKVWSYRIQSRLSDILLMKITQRFFF
ncbi:MAG TPA: hypothetical protein VKT74_08240, partial [Gammaproteobacteria bacterium]|nr:hypothetical protein [Gammaproteobacteria bacterium]